MRCILKCGKTAVRRGRPRRPRLTVVPTTAPGSLACSFIRTEIPPFRTPRPLFFFFIATAVEQSRLVGPAGLIVTRSGSSDQIAEHIVQVVGAGSGAV
jgi:hypothetical protein